MGKMMINMRGEKTLKKSWCEIIQETDNHSSISQGWTHSYHFYNQEPFDTAWEVHGSCLKIAVFKLSR